MKGSVVAARELRIGNVPSAAPTTEIPIRSVGNAESLNLPRRLLPELVTDHEFKEAVKTLDRRDRIIALYLAEKIDEAKALRILDEERLKKEIGSTALEILKKESYEVFFSYEKRLLELVDSVAKDRKAAARIFEVLQANHTRIAANLVLLAKRLNIKLTATEFTPITGEIRGIDLKK